MNDSVLFFLIGTLVAVLSTVYIKYQDKRRKGQLEKASFKWRYTIPGLAMFLSLLVTLQIHVMAQVVPSDPMVALLTGLAFGSAFEEGHKTAWRFLMLILYGVQD